MDSTNHDQERSATWAKISSLIEQAISDPDLRQALQSEDRDRIVSCLEPFDLSETDVRAWGSELETAFGKPLLFFWYFIQGDTVAE